MSKKKRIVKAEPKQEPTPEELEVTEEQPTPQEAPPETTEPEPDLREEATPDPRLTTFEAEILRLYSEAADSTELIPYFVAETGKSEIEIRQAWDRLYDYHLVQRSVVPYRK